MKYANKLLLQSVGIVKPTYKDADWDEITETLKSDFEEYFKTTPFYSGDNCSPKYETYRMMWKAYVNGFKKMVNIVYQDAYPDDYGNTGLDEHCLTCKIVYNDSLF